MTYLITIAELEHLSETELRSKLCWIQTELTRQQLSAQECPLAMASLRNIQTALIRRRMQGPRM